MSAESSVYSHYTSSGVKQKSIANSSFQRRCFISAEKDGNGPVEEEKDVDLNCFENFDFEDVPIRIQIEKTGSVTRAVEAEGHIEEGNNSASNLNKSGAFIETASSYV